MSTLFDTWFCEDFQEVFWTRWVDGDRERIMLLNTDWTTPDNEKEVTLVTSKNRIPIRVREGILTIADVNDGSVCVSAMTPV